jgi:hypothetical protein
MIAAKRRKASHIGFQSIADQNPSPLTEMVMPERSAGRCLDFAKIHNTFGFGNCRSVSSIEAAPQPSWWQRFFQALSHNIGG